MTETDYKVYRRHFRKVDVTAHVLTSMLYLFAHRMTVQFLRLIRIRWWPPESAALLRMCDRVDRWMTHIPGMKSQMWYSLIEMRQ